MQRIIFLSILMFFSFVFRIEAQKKDSTLILKVKSSNMDSSMVKSIDKSSKVIIKKQRTIFDDQLDSVYQWRISQSELDGVYIPFDLFDCFRQLDRLMEPAAKKEFMDFSDEEVDKRTHGTLGVWINNKWQISDGSRISAYFGKMGVPHPDYMVGIIITTYHRHLHKRDLKIKELIEFFREIWNKKQKERAKEMIQKSNADNSKSTNSGK